MKNRRRMMAVVALPLLAAAGSAFVVKAAAVVSPAETPSFAIDLAGTDIGAVSPGSRDVLDVDWGDQSEDAGKTGGNEADLLGASSFTVSPSGDIYLLDQVKNRVSRFSSTAKKIEDIPIPEASVQEIQIGADDDLYLLDGLREPKVYHIAKGKLKRTIEISAKKAKSARFAAFTGLQVSGGQVSVELGHEDVLDLTDETGRKLAEADQEVAPFRGGRTTRGNVARKVFPEAVGRDRVDLLVTSASDKPLYRMKLRSKRPVESILDVKSDRSGAIYVLLQLMRPASDSKATDGADGLTLVSFGADGDFRGQLDLPYKYLTDRFREIEITATGEIYQLQTTRQGVKIVSWPRMQ